MDACTKFTESTHRDNPVRARYSAPYLTAPEEWDLPVSQLQDIVLDEKATPAERMIAALKLEVADEPQCKICDDVRWGHFGMVTYTLDSYGLPDSIHDDGWSPCPTCNAEGKAGEGEPVVEVPPALLPALCGFGALMMDVAAPREEVAA